MGTLRWLWTGVILDVVVSCARRFKRTPDGACWTTSTDDYGFWRRYLSAFDCVRVVARVKDVRRKGPGWREVSGPQVVVYDIPHYIGLRGYIHNIARIRKAARACFSTEDAVILRVPSHVASSIEPYLRRARHPYAAEITGDPYEAFAPGSIDHPLRPFLRWHNTTTLKRQCWNAVAVSYVTRETLQKRYPSHPAAFSTHYSSIQLPDSAIAQVPKPPPRAGEAITVISVGSMELSYKGFDVLIQAVRRCIERGLNLRLVLIGGGRSKSKIETEAQDIRDRVCFMGELPGSEWVLEELFKADLFVLSSKTEGLPRAMIEAMGVGLPCLGSRIGGIPELLALEHTFTPGDPAELAGKIEVVTRNPQKMVEMSATNIQMVRQFAESILSLRRKEFYEVVREVTEGHFKRAGRRGALCPRTGQAVSDPQTENNSRRS